MLLKISEMDAEILLTAILEKYKRATLDNELLRDKVSELEKKLTATGKTETKEADKNV